MATATRAFVAGFLAAMRMCEAGNKTELKGRLATKKEARKLPSLPPTNNRALETYLAVPTFIRQGRAIER